MNEHVNMAEFIAPKSDQINSDDLIGGPRTITITSVSANEGSPEQPINVRFEGDDNKPFRPCKSMRRVMVKIWGSDASQYAGRSMTIHRDPKVKWGGMEVGGIRITHMTGLEKPEVMALTETRSARKPYTVQPLKAPAAKARQTPQEWAEGQLYLVEQAKDLPTLDRIIASGERAVAKLREGHPDIAVKINDAYVAASERVSRPDEPEPDNDTFDADPFDTEAVE